MVYILSSKYGIRTYDTIMNIVNSHIHDNGRHQDLDHDQQNDHDLDHDSDYDCMTE